MEAKKKTAWKIVEIDPNSGLGAKVVDLCAPGVAHVWALHMDELSSTDIMTHKEARKAYTREYPKAIIMAVCRRKKVVYLAEVKR